MKSTPARGVKETRNRMPTNRWSRLTKGELLLRTLASTMDVETNVTVKAAARVSASVLNSRTKEPFAFGELVTSYLLYNGSASSSV